MLEIDKSARKVAYNFIELISEKEKNKIHKGREDAIFVN